VKAGDVLVEIDPQTAKGRGAGRGPRAGARRPRPRRAELSAVSSAGEERVRVGARARHGPDAVRAGERRRPAGRRGRRGRLVRRGRSRASSRRSRAGSRPGWWSRATSRRPDAPRDGRVGGRPALVVSVPPRPPSPRDSRRAEIAVRVDGIAAPLTGVVAEVSPGADPSSHTFTAKIDSPARRSRRTHRAAALDAGKRKAVLVPAARSSPRRPVHGLRPRRRRKVPFPRVTTARRTTDGGSPLGLSGARPSSSG